MIIIPRQLFFLTALLLFFQVQMRSQVSISGYAGGAATIIDNPLIDFSQGLFPEVQVGLQIERDYFIALDFQRVFWRNRDPFIDKMRSSIFEFKAGMTMPFKGHTILYQVGVDYMVNDLLFDPDGTPESFRKYQEDYHWENMGIAIQAEFEHKIGFLGRLGYRHYFGTELMPANKFGTLELAFGYRFKFKEK